MKTLSNQPDAPNPAIARQFAVERHGRGVSDPERWHSTSPIKPKLARYILVVALFASLIGCSQKNAVVGLWQYGDDQVFWEFRADGTFQVHGHNTSKLNGRYWWVREGEIQYQAAGSIHPAQTLRFTLIGDELTILDNRTNLTLHRSEPSKIELEIPYEEELQRQVDAWLPAGSNQPATNP